MENYYEHYNGFWIYRINKIVFGAIRPMYCVEQFDTVIFENSDLNLCHKFCDDFNNAFKAKTGKMQGDFSNMNKYAIVFGKDPEYIPDWCWPDNYEDTDEFNNAFVAGRFETDNFNLFHKMFVTIVNNPCTMWYWVLDDGHACISGAIDPGDIEIFEEVYEDRLINSIKENV